DVANRDDIVRPELVQQAHQVLAAASGTNGAKPDPVVRAENAAVRRGGREGGAHKAPAVRHGMFLRHVWVPGTSTISRPEGIMLGTSTAGKLFFRHSSTIPFYALSIFNSLATFRGWSCKCFQEERSRLLTISGRNKR